MNVPAAGLTVVFAQGFHVAPNVMITGQNLASGDYFTMTRTRTGFTIQFFDKNSTAVARQCNWTASGYGAEA